MNLKKTRRGHLGRLEENKVKGENDVIIISKMYLKMM